VDCHLAHHWGPNAAPSSSGRQISQVHELHLVGTGVPPVQQGSRAIRQGAGDEPFRGVWYIPHDGETVLPVIVEAREL
jgi:hypothetical protein